MRINQGQEFVIGGYNKFDWQDTTTVQASLSIATCEPGADDDAF
jgi:hypothetical protein